MAIININIMNTNMMNTNISQHDKSKLINLINDDLINSEQTVICKFIRSLNNFIYQCDNHGSYSLYCFNGRTWSINDIIMSKSLSSEIYDFLKTILIEYFHQHKDFNIMVNKIGKLKTMSFKKSTIKTYKKYGLDNSIKFDNNPYLFGFCDNVYDLQKREYRNYSYDDYMTTNCGYMWRDPTDEELFTVNELLCKIMPSEGNRSDLLRIMSEGLCGTCSNKIYMYNGQGGNGKSVLNDLFLHSLGSYGLIGCSAVLHNKPKDNIETLNLYGKRYIVFNEISQRKKINDHMRMELTGNDSMIKTNDKFNSTVVIESNQQSNPDIANVFFGSTFTDNDELLDDTKHIYKMNKYYKTNEFQEKHKFALLKILFDVFT